MQSLSRIEQGAEVADSIDLRGHWLRLVRRPWHPPSQVLQAPDDGVHHRLGVLRLPTSKHEMLGLYAIGCALPRFGHDAGDGMQKPLAQLR